MGRTEWEQTMKPALSLRLRLTVTAVAIACGALLTIHFAATVLYLLPLNPLRIAYGSGVDEYMQPYFRQRWSLFAPDPPLDNKVLMLRCRLRSAQGVQESDWIDLDKTVVHARRRGVFGPEERIARVDRAVLAAALGTREEMVELFTEKLKERIAKSEQENAAEPSAEELKFREVAKRVADRKTDQLEAMRPFVDRVGSSYCEAFHGHGRVLASQFRIVIHRFPRYSERAQPDDFGEKKAMLLSWGDHVDGISPLRI